MTTVAAHIDQFIAEFADVIPKRPRNISLDSFAKIEKAAATAIKAAPPVQAIAKAVRRDVVLPKGIYIDPCKRLDLRDFDGLGW